MLNSFTFAYCGGRRIWFADSDTIPTGKQYKKGDLFISKLTGKYLGTWNGSGVAPLALHTEATDATAGALTITAAMVLGGLLTRDPAGSARADVLPTAALLVAAITSTFVNQELKFLIVNMADAAETITLTAGVGGTMHPPAVTIVQNEAKKFLIKITSIASANESYDVFAMS